MRPTVKNLKRALYHMNLASPNIDGMNYYAVRHWMCHLATHTHDEVMRLAEEFGEGAAEQRYGTSEIGIITELVEAARAIVENGGIHGVGLDRLEAAVAGYDKGAVT